MDFTKIPYPFTPEGFPIDDCQWHLWEWKGYATQVDFAFSDCILGGYHMVLSKIGNGQNKEELLLKDMNLQTRVDPKPKRRPSWLWKSSKSTNL